MLNFNIKLKKRSVPVIALSFLVLITSIGCAIWATTNHFRFNNENEIPITEINEVKNTIAESKQTSNNEESSIKIDETDSPKELSSVKAVKKEEKISKEKNSEQIKAAVNADYTKLYPELYCTRPETQITPSKTIFLTFDDGPSARTSEILDILRQNDIKATFFVIGNESEKGKALMKQIVDEGHTIGIHTYTHEFRQVYSSVNAFLDDFNKIYNLIYQTTGIKPTIFRFPGGSKNSFNKNNYKEIISEMTRRGFDYFDWNLSVGDAVSRTPTPTQKCINNVLNFSKNCDHGVILMHDAQPKTTTVEALPHIINGLKEQGFTFDKLSHNIDPAPYSLVKPYK